MAEPSDSAPEKVVQGIVCNYCGSKNLRGTGEIELPEDFYDHSVFHRVVCTDCRRNLWVRRITENDGFSNINEVPTRMLSDEDVSGCDDYRKFKCPKCQKRGALTDFRSRWYVNKYIGYYCVCENCSIRYVHYDKLFTMGFESLAFDDLKDYFRYENEERSLRLKGIFGSWVKKD